MNELLHAHLCTGDFVLECEGGKSRQFMDIARSSRQTTFRIFFNFPNTAKAAKREVCTLKKRVCVCVPWQK